MFPLLSAHAGRLGIFAAVLAFWLIAKPFQGIWHDGRLYALQALRHVSPSTFSGDLFFFQGSQDQYSLFSSLYALAISLWGLTQGTMVLQGLGLAVWFLGAAMLTHVLPDRPAKFALLLVVAVDGAYGSHGVFSYGEGFLTARLYAEAISLSGLAAWLAGRTLPGLLAFAAAMLIHPLMTLPSLMIGLGILLPPRIWFGVMAAGLLFAVGLGAMDVAPFTGLLQPMDTPWREVVASRSPFLFLTSWEWGGLSRVLFVTIVTATAWCFLPDGRLRHLSWVTLICVLGAFAGDYVGGSLLALPLVVGLQLTRVIWIAFVIALVLVTAMLWTVGSRNIWERVLIWGLALSVFLDMRTQGAYAVLVLSIALIGRRYVPDYKPPFWFWALLGLVPLNVLAWGVLNTMAEVRLETLMTERLVWRPYIVGPAFTVVVAACAYWLLRRDQSCRPLVWLGASISGAAVVFSVMTWNNQQADLNFDSPARRAAIAQIAAQVPDDATVYWVEAPDKAWFWLGRVNYLSFVQTAGSVFSRETAMEAKRRGPYARASSGNDSSQSWHGRPQTGRLGVMSVSAARRACADPLLDYVIDRAQPQPGLTYFKDPATGWGYGLYDCRSGRTSSSSFVPDGSGKEVGRLP